ncbi:hypothetical protein D9M68_912310 [compost metagenome]
MQFVGVAIQRGVGVNLDLDLAGQAFFDQSFEQQGALALGRSLGDHMGELDQDGALRLRAVGAGRTEYQGAGGHGEDRLEHRAVLSCY